MDLLTGFSILLFVLLIPTSSRGSSIPEPSNVHVQNIWPGQVQVMWAYSGSKHTIFRVTYGVKDQGPSVTYQTPALSSHVTILTRLRGKSTYWVRVTAQLGSHVTQSRPMSVLVREGVPWQPRNLTATYIHEKNVTRLTWTRAGKTEVDYYTVVLATNNFSRVVGKPRSASFDLTQENLTDYSVEVRAVNKVGESDTAVLHVGSGGKPIFGDGKKKRVGKLPTSHMILVIALPLCAAAAALFSVALIFGCKRRRRLSAMNRSSGSEALFYMPLRRKRYENEDDNAGESYAVSFRNNRGHTDVTGTPVFQNKEGRQKVTPTKLPYRPPSDKPHYCRPPDVSPNETGPTRHVYGRRSSSRLNSLTSNSSESSRSRKIPIIPLSSVNIPLDRYLIHPETLSGSERSVRYSWDSEASNRSSHIYSTMGDER